MRVWVEYHQFYVGPDGDFSSIYEATPFEGGLVRTTGPALAVQCGISMGNVDVQVEQLPGRPVEVSSGWEGVVEVPLDVTGTSVIAGGGFNEVVSAFVRGPGRFQVRVHAHGRAAEWDLVNEDSQERYLLQVWHTEAPETQVLLLDSTGRDILAAEAAANPQG
jgi:hypothetical protein